MDQFYANNDEDVIIMLKQLYNHQEGVCVIANLSDK